MATNILASVSVVLGAEIGEFRAKMAEARKELSGLLKFADGATDIGKSLSTFVTLPLLALGGAAVKMAGDMEKAQASFTTFLGSADAAKKTLGELKQFAADTPFEFPEIQAAAQKLLAFNTPAKDLKETLRQLGDVSAGIGAPIGEIAEIFGKARVQGRLFQEDINQLTGRGIPIIGELAKQFGVAESGVRKLVESGKVNFGNLQTAFADLTKEGGKFGGLMAQQSQTLPGLFSTLKDNVGQSLAGLGADLVTAFNLKELLRQVGDFVKSTADAFAGLSPEAKKVIFVLAGIAAAAGPLLVAVGTLGLALPVLTVGFGALGTAATATWIAVTGPIGLTVLGIAAVAAGAAVLVNRFGSVEKVAAAFGAAVTNLASKALAALSAGLALTGLPLFASLAAEAAAKVGELAARLGLLSAPTKALAGSFDAAFRQPDYFADELTKTAAPMRVLTELTDKQRKALEDQLKALQDLNKGYDNIGIRSVLKVPETADFALKLPTGAGLPTALQTAPGFDTTSLSDSAEAARLAYEKLSDSQKAAYKGTLEFNTGFGAAMEQLSASIGPLLADIAGQVGTAFASIVVGTASAGDALATLFGGILQSIGGFMTTFGKQLVVLGIGKIGLDNLFKGAAGGPLALAAGLGLIALGSLAGAVGSSAASSVSSISSGGTGGNSTRPTFTPTTAPNVTAPAVGGTTRNIHNVVFELSGNKLMAAFDLETDRLGRVIGSGRR